MQKKLLTANEVADIALDQNSSFHNLRLFRDSFRDNMYNWQSDAAAGMVDLAFNAPILYDKIQQRIATYLPDHLNFFTKEHGTETNTTSSSETKIKSS